MKTTSEKLRSIADGLLALAKTIDEKGMGALPDNIQPYDVICSIGASKARLDILLDKLQTPQPQQIEDGEWYFMGCFIQKQTHPQLLPYVVFKDDETQSHVGVCCTMKEARQMCLLNKVESPKIGLLAFGVCQS